MAKRPSAAICSGSPILTSPILGDNQRMRPWAGSISSVVRRKVFPACRRRLPRRRHSRLLARRAGFARRARSWSSHGRAAYRWPVSASALRRTRPSADCLPRVGGPRNYGAARAARQDRNAGPTDRSRRLTDPLKSGSAGPWPAASRTPASARSQSRRSGQLGSGSSAGQRDAGRKEGRNSVAARIASKGDGPCDTNKLLSSHCLTGVGWDQIA